MKSVTTIFFVLLAITLVTTSYAAPSKLELQSSHQPREYYNEMGHIVVNFLIDLLSTIRKNIENDDEATKGTPQVQLKLARKMLQFFGKQIATSDDKIGQTIFNAVNAIFSPLLKAAETNLNQRDSLDEFNQESLPIPAIVQTLMSHSDWKKRSSNVANTH